MKQQNVILGILALFLAIHILGLFTANYLIGFFSVNPDMEVFANPSDVSNSFSIFLYVLLGTAALLIVIKFWKGFLKYLELMVVFISSEITFEAFLPFIIFEIPVAVALALALAVWKFKWPNIVSQNTALIFSLSGAGALLGTSLEVLPIIIFIAILSVYDIISVFFTKHMVYMAQAITERPFAFVAAIPTTFAKPKEVASLQSGKSEMKQEHVFQLGGGDLAIPLVLSASVFRYFSLENAIMTSLGALIATFVIFWIVFQKPGKPLPALPPIALGAILGFGLSLLVLPPEDIFFL